MDSYIRGLTAYMADSPALPSSHSSIVAQCESLSSYRNKSANTNDPQSSPFFFQQLLAKTNSTFSIPKTVAECVIQLTALGNRTNELNTTSKGYKTKKISLPEYSPSLIIFVTLIACVSLISVIGNLCLAKVLYSKRFRLIQTDRIVLCLALSKKVF
jgi:hypothetical protein